VRYPNEGPKIRGPEWTGTCKACGLTFIADARDFSHGVLTCPMLGCSERFTNDPTRGIEKVDPRPFAGRIVR